MKIMQSYTHCGYNTLLINKAISTADAVVHATLIITHSMHAIYPIFRENMYMHSLYCVPFQRNVE